MAGVQKHSEKAAERARQECKLVITSMITIIETKTNDDAQAVGGAAAMSIDDDVQKEAHCPACAASESTTSLKDRGVVTTLMKAAAACEWREEAGVHVREPCDRTRQL